MPDPSNLAPAMRSLTPPVYLPDGKEFRTWEPESAPVFGNTLHVDNGHRYAADDNPGTPDRPLRTVNAAAHIALPGDRVLIHSGIYRERVAPRWGGNGPDSMIHYEAASGGDVVIKGSIVAPQQWRRGSGSENEWIIDIDPEWFEDGCNPFDVENVTPAQFDSMDWTHPERDNPLFSLPRGMVFQDGERLLQVNTANELQGAEASYWVDRARQRLHVRPSGDRTPSSAVFEIAVRETVFAPRVENLGYIRISGITVEHAAGPWPFPQLGAISTMRGHHWIIENNTVRQVNAVGIDIGRQKLEDYSNIYGHHIVRQNRIADCGICGINGFGPGDGDVEFGLLVENNAIERTGFHAAENLHECGGIKLHCCNRCLIRRNLVTDTIQGPGIWIDAHNAYTRCCQNVILNSMGRCGLFFEISFKPNLVDSNIIWSATECGILEADGRGQTFAHNFIGKCREGIELRGRQTDRIAAEDCGGHQVYNNVIVDCGVAILEKSLIPSQVEGNLVEMVTASLRRDALLLTWSAGSGAPSTPVVAVNTWSHDFLDRPVVSDPAPGPFGEIPASSETYDLAQKVHSTLSKH